MGFRQAALEFLEVGLIGGGKVRGAELHVVDVVPGRNHLREVEQRQHISRQGEVFSRVV